MPERASVLQAVQIAVEVTPGTAVAASKRLLCTQINPVPKVPVKPFRPTGGKVATAATAGKEMSEASIEGVLAFNDLVYLLSGVLVAGTTAGAGVDKTWTFQPATFSADTMKTFSVEVGSSTRAEKFAYGVITDLMLRFTQEEAAISGRMFGRTLGEGATMTASPTDIAQVPVNPKNVNVFVGSSVGSLTKLNRCLEAELRFGGRQAPLFTFDSTQDSFVAPVERAVETSAQIVLEHDSEASAFMTDLRAATRKIARISVSQGDTGAAVPYSLTITFPFVFGEQDRGDRDNVYGSTWNLIPQYDTTLGYWMNIAVVNTLGAL